LDFLKRVGVSFGWLSSMRVDGSVLHRVDAIVKTEPLRLFENAAQHRLNPLQAVAGQVFVPDLVEPSLHSEGAEVFQTGTLMSTHGLEVIFPYIVIPFVGARLFRFLHPGQICDEVRETDDSIRCNAAIIDGCHEPFGFIFDIGRRALAACRYQASWMGHAFSFDRAADVSAFPIANVPAFPDSDYLTFLFSHLSFPFPLAFTGFNGQLRNPFALGSG